MLYSLPMRATYLVPFVSSRQDLFNLAMLYVMPCIIAHTIRILQQLQYSSLNAKPSHQVPLPYIWHVIINCQPSDPYRSFTPGWWQCMDRAFSIHAQWVVSVKCIGTQHQAWGWHHQLFHDDHKQCCLWQRSFSVCSQPMRDDVIM